MKLTITFVLLLCTSLFLYNQTSSTVIDQKELKYNFTYNFQMDMEGTYLLVVPYRFFHEVSASVNFIARKTEKGHYEFCYAGIGSTGYVLATGGLTGNSLWFFSADYDLEKAADFRENKIVSFKKAYPYYAGKIKKIRRRPMKILSNTEDAIRFNRDKKGIHFNSLVNIQLTDPHSFTYSNIYKILGKLITTYNHSFLPGDWDVTKISRLEQKTTRIWYSKPLDFSKALGGAARLTSEGAEKNANFNQEQKFQLQYRVAAINNNTIEICGESFPQVKIWKNLKVRHTLRKIKIRLEDNVVTEDMMYLDFKNKKGKGGTVYLNLQLLKL